MSIIKATAIIFDLDGVLANSIAILEESWAIWCAEKGLDFETVMNVAHGRRKSEILAVVYPDHDPQPEIDYLKQLEFDRVGGVKAIPGAAAAVAQMPVGRWAIGTSGDLEGALQRLKQVGIAPPPVLISSENVERGKPNPEVYLKAAAGIEMAPDECVVFEDAPAGVAAALAAGMTPVALLTTYPAEAFPPDIHKISDFTQVFFVFDGDHFTIEL